MAGFVIHSAIDEAHPHLNCVIHTHTADGIAVSAQKHGASPNFPARHEILSACGLSRIRRRCAFN